ncbi:TPA: hypothetical protein ACSP3M_004020 [Aeromonas veronii]
MENKNILVVNIVDTYQTKRDPVSCTRSAWLVDADKAQFIDTVVGVYDHKIRVVIKGCRLILSTPEENVDHDDGCVGRWFADGGDAFSEKGALTVRNECPQVFETLASVQGIRYLTQEQFDQIPNGKIKLK